MQAFLMPSSTNMGLLIETCAVVGADAASNQPSANSWTLCYKYMYRYLQCF